MKATASWDDRYAMHIWPCATALGNYLARHREAIEHRTVLELGAGATGIPGLVAHSIGARCVVLTEKADNDSSLSLLMENCVSNSKSSMVQVDSKSSMVQVDPTSSMVQVEGLTWGDETSARQLVHRIRPDWLLASDCFYDQSRFAPLILTIAVIIKECPGCALLFSYEERDNDWTIEDRLRQVDLHCWHLEEIESEHGRSLHIGLIANSADIEDAHWRSMIN